MQKIPPAQLSKVVNLLEQDAILAVPTETVYGLAVKLDCPVAIDKLLQLKHRQKGIDDTKILTLMLADIAQIPIYAQLEPVAKSIAQQHFPGQLTIVLSKSSTFQHAYFDQFTTIGIRIPNHPFMLKLLQKSGPLLVTSANFRGDPPCLASDEVISRLPTIDAVVTGQSGNHPPSTVISIINNQINTLRQGNLTL